MSNPAGATDRATPRGSRGSPAGSDGVGGLLLRHRSWHRLRRLRIAKKRQPRYGLAACAQHYIEGLILRELFARMEVAFSEFGQVLHDGRTVHPRESGGISNPAVGKFTA